MIFESVQAHHFLERFTMRMINFHKDFADLNDPYRAHPTDAGWDLPSAENVTLAPGERCVVDTGISVETPEGCFAMMTPRSGLAAHFGITIVNSPGIIDSHYRGNLKVIMLNTSDKHFHVSKNDRIAQLVFMSQYAVADMKEVETLNTTDRGANGLGSTGK